MSIQKAMTFADNGDYKSAYEELMKLMTAPATMDWVKDYNNLFPTETMAMAAGTMLGYGPRESLTHVTSRMKTFLKSWPTRFRDMKAAPAERPEIIMNATRAYTQEREAAGWSFTKKSTKFIYDNNGSELEAWIRKTMHEEPGTGKTKRMLW